MNLTEFIYAVSVPYSVTIISFAGLITNSVNLLILFKIKSKTDLHHIRKLWCWLVIIYLLFYGIVDTLSNYKFHKTYADCLIHLYIGLFLTSVLTINIICVQIIYFYLNYLLIMNRRDTWFYTPIRRVFFIGVIMTVGALVYSPLIVIWDFERDKNSQKCVLKLTEFGKGIGNSYVLVVAVLQSVIASVPLIMFNIMTYFKYKKVLVFSNSNINKHRFFSILFFLLNYLF